jgi:hypothetical protein
MIDLKKANVITTVIASALACACATAEAATRIEGQVQAGGGAPVPHGNWRKAGRAEMDASS